MSIALLCRKKREQVAVKAFVSGDTPRPPTVSRPLIAGRGRSSGDGVGLGIVSALSLGLISVLVPAGTTASCPTLQRCEERIGFDRFADVIVHAHVHAVLAFLDQGVRGHGDDGQIAKFGLRAK